MPFYTIADNVPMGHGSKSVIMLQQLGVKLTKDELYAILWHMGFTVPKEDYNTLGKAFEMYPLALKFMTVLQLCKNNLKLMKL